MYKYDMSDFENEEQKRKYIKEVNFGKDIRNGYSNFLNR